MKLIAELKLWKVMETDAVHHAIIAESDAEAAGIWLEHFIKSNGDDTCPDELPKMESYLRDEQYTFAPWGDERKLTATASEWVHFFGRPMYLGCSEF